MATKARTRQKKSKSRPYGRFILILLALASLAGIGYFVFLQVPLFPPAAEQTPTSEVAKTPQAQPSVDEPLTTPPAAESLPPEPTPPETTPPAPAADMAPVMAPPAAPPVAVPSEPAIAPAAPAKQAANPTPAKSTPATEVPPPPAATPAAHKEPPATPRKKPMVAIIIDDMGYQPAIGRKMLDLPLPLSFSFLPGGPQTKELASAAKSRKRDILLHLPLEATDRKVDPGPGTLAVAMDPQELEKKFAEDLAAVPMAIGLNNHMGSRFTEERPAMAALLTQVRQRGLFFLDSRTSNKSVACAVAKEAGVPCLSRHLFLDNDQSQAAVVKQVDALLALAEKNGWAVGIGHPHPATLAALTARQQALTERAAVVGIGTIFRTHGR
jgi:polysaccharide deacetylase 2 family uncharacterized protein YibQ